MNLAAAIPLPRQIIRFRRPSWRGWLGVWNNCLYYVRRSNLPNPRWPRPLPQDAEVLPDRTREY